MRFTWTNVTERGILVSNFSMTRNSLLELYTLDRLVSACLISSVRLAITSAAPCLEGRNPIVVY